jgi:putative iron-regulated protein
MKLSTKRWRRTGVPFLLCAALLVPSGELQALATCAGDCNREGGVTIEEIIVGVNIILGAAPAVQCDAFDRDGDGVVGIDDIVAAVRAAADGCVTQEVTPAAVIANYAALLYANYSEALAAAHGLRAAVDAFLDQPTTATFAAAKASWLDARPSYLQTEMARFYDGPIDNPDDGPEGWINSWPLDEAYIDYVDGDPGAGIINDPIHHPVLTRDLLVDLNEAGGETNISTGWHAIEFLLWGRDHSATGPGDRPFTDYLAAGAGTATNQERRGQYLRLLAELLVDDLEQVTAAWAPGQPGNYRASFVALPPNEALRRILTGMGTLSGGELTGERLSVAFDTKDQEDEHSCFSDNTHIDHRYDAIGIQNVWLGRYGPIDGPALDDLVRALNPSLARRTRTQIAAAIAAIFAIPVPFDQAILGPDSAPGRVAIAAAITALNMQTNLIAESAAALGISISTTAG